ncbi:L-2-aminoadipate reductase, partial [Colletotrichum tanaceti]
LIDFNAAHNPSHPFCVQAKAAGPFDTVTHAEFKVAVSRCAAWLKENLPLTSAGDNKSDSAASNKTMAPVALFMESGVGLVMHEFALMSIGVPALVISPRLPPAAINALIKATSAASFIVSQRLSEPAKPALAALASKGISTHVANRYDAFYQPNTDTSSSSVESWPAFESPEDRNGVILLLHSSGTTGFPKPIPLNHRQLLFALSCHGFDTEEEAQGLNLSTLPLFHGFGLVAPGLALSAGKPTLYPASDGIPDAASIVDLVKRTGARSMMTVPFLLDAICDLPDDRGIRALAHMDFVGTGGAALRAGVGDRLAAGGVRLLNFYGTTEAGHLSLIFAPKLRKGTEGGGSSYDWKYFRLRNDIKFTLAELESPSPQPSSRGEDGGQRRFRLTVFPFGNDEDDDKGIEIADQLVRNERVYRDEGIADLAAVGRDDDVIVLATGEKADPLILETMLGETPGVKSAVAFGENQFHLGVIVEPREPQRLLGPGDVEAFRRDVIWPVVAAAGQRMDGSARVPSPDAIVVVVPEANKNKVVPRTDKGSIARRETYALFDEEIRAVYERLAGAADAAATPEMGAVGPLDLDDLEESIRALVDEHLRRRLGPQMHMPAWTVDDSLFDLGVDSLQALQLRRVLVAAASKTKGLGLGLDPGAGAGAGDVKVDVAEMIPSQFIYRNPSVREMAAAILQRRSSGEQTDSSKSFSLSYSSSRDPVVQEVKELADRYSLGGGAGGTEEEEKEKEKKEPSGGSNSNAEKAVVLLTGSSGSLGSHCVADLARRPQVRHIICVIRKDKGASAMSSSSPAPGGDGGEEGGPPFDREILKARGLEIAEEEWSKVAALEVDPTADRLGLTPAAYAAMQESVTHVIHAAWPMNYLMPLRSFRYQLQFLRGLLEFAAGTAAVHGPTGRTKRCRLIFVSSIAAVAKIGLDATTTTTNTTATNNNKLGGAASVLRIPEAPVSPEEAACGIGYADGKLVCEKMVERAAQTLTHAGRLEVTSVRCGQIAGARGTGVWNTNEQIPMLLKSAQSLGSLPQLSGELSWIPVDDAASVISEIALSPEPLPVTLHLENPTRQPWSELMEFFGTQLDLKPSVPFPEWLEQVAAAAAEQDDDDDKFPVKKLHAFFQHLFRPVACGSVVLDTSVAQTRSATLRDLGALDDATLDAYVKYWQDVGYLSRC